MSEYVIRKYDGDDRYSWAVFKRSQVSGLGRGVIFAGQATPRVSGCSREEAEYYKRQFETGKL